MPQQQNVVVVFELLCKTDFSPRMLISSWLSSLCEAIMLPKPKHIASSASTQCNRSTNTVLLSDWTTDYTFGMESVMITIHVHLRRERRSLMLQVWQSETTTLLRLTGAVSWCFLDPQQGYWTGYHALWFQTLSPADSEDVCLLSQAWLVTSTSYFPVVSWGSCRGELSPHHRTHCINTYKSFYTH